MSFIFDKLASSFRINVLKYALNHFSVQKTVSEALKAWYFLYAAFWLAGQWGWAIILLAQVTLLIRGVNCVIRYVKCVIHSTDDTLG